MSTGSLILCLVMELSWLYLSKCSGAFQVAVPILSHSPLPLQALFSGWSLPCLVTQGSSTDWFRALGGVICAYIRNDTLRKDIDMMCQKNGDKVFQSQDNLFNSYCFLYFQECLLAFCFILFFWGWNFRVRHCLFVSLDTVLLCSPGWLWIHNPPVWDCRHGPLCLAKMTFLFCTLFAVLAREDLCILGCRSSAVTSCSPFWSLTVTVGMDSHCSGSAMCEVRDPNWTPDYLGF
jgi:hypothetical protein